MNLYQVKNIVSLLWASLGTIPKVLVLSNWFITHNQRATNSDCIILGNGPSLNHFLQNETSFIANKNLVAVNFFGRTKEFELLKPSHYVIISPNYFHVTGIKDQDDSRALTLETIAKKTTWPMTLYLPVLAKKKSFWKKEITKNSNIKIQYFNNTPIEGFFSLNRIWYRLNMGMPRPHNVLVGSIFLMIRQGYKNIFITGADHSWLENIRINENNVVMGKQDHFYGKDFAGDSANSDEHRVGTFAHFNRPRKLHETLEKYYYTFRSYWELKRYADSKKTRIINISKKSYIDAFERMKIKE